MGGVDSVAARCEEVSHATQESPTHRAAARTGAKGQLDHWYQEMQKSDASQNLFDASVRGDAKAAMLALVAQAEPNCCSHDGITPLMVGVAGGHVEVSRLLVTSGAKVNSTPCPWGLCPVGMAAAQGNMALVEMLLQWKADANMCSSSGNAPLMRAASNGHLSVCKVLLEHSAEPDSSDYAGVTASMVAVDRENTEVFKLLVQFRASMAMSDHEGRSALSRAVDILLRVDPQNPQLLAGSDHLSKYGSWSELSRRMVSECKANPNVADAAGETLLARVVRFRRQDLVYLLLGFGAQIDFPVPCLDGGTALLKALKEADADLVQTLLIRSASVNHPNGRGLSPLFVATEWGNEDIIRILVKFSADVNRRNPRTGETLIARLASRGFVSTYNSLLSRCPVNALGGDASCNPSRDVEDLLQSD